MGPDQQFTFELLKELKITKAIINETLRIHLPASRIARVTLKDTVLPIGGGQDGRSPLFVPKGQVVEMELFTLQRDPRTGETMRRSSFLGVGVRVGLCGKRIGMPYEPFLGGMRMCPAQEPGPDANGVSPREIGAGVQSD